MMRIKILLLLVLVLSGCKNQNFGSIELKEVKESKIKIGEKYINIFEDNNGKLIEIEITKDEYESLKFNKKPYYNGYKWIKSFGGVPIYSTSTPILNNNEYLILDNSTTTGKAKIKLINENEKQITIQELNEIR